MSPDRLSESVLKRATILGGCGQVGMLLSHSLRASGIRVTIVDASPPRIEASDALTYLRADVTAENMELKEAIAETEAVFICLPETTTLRIFPFIVSALPDESLWVDTLSVKSDVVAKLKATPGRLQAISINPMFAPKSGWANNAVATIEVFGGPRTLALKALLTAWGARVEETTAEEHDRLTAGIQVATHAAILSFGAALLASDLTVERILRLATPPHKLLLTLLHRITTQSPEVYWDVQAYHPLGPAVREEMVTALRAMGAEAAIDASMRFSDLHGRLKALFENEDQLFSEWEKRVFGLQQEETRG